MLYHFLQALSRKFSLLSAFCFWLVKIVSPYFLGPLTSEYTQSLKAPHARSGEVSFSVLIVRTLQPSKPDVAVARTSPTSPTEAYKGL